MDVRTGMPQSEDQNDTGRHGAYSPEDGRVPGDPQMTRHAQYAHTLRPHNTVAPADASAAKRGCRPRMPTLQDLKNPWVVLCGILIAVIILLAILLPILLTSNMGKNPDSGAIQGGSQAEPSAEPEPPIDPQDRVFTDGNGSSSQLDGDDDGLKQETGDGQDTDSGIDTDDESTDAGAATSPGPELPKYSTPDDALRVFKRPNVRKCEDEGFVCPDDATVVVGAMQLCDGHADCPGGADEQQCETCKTAFTCPTADGHLQCVRGERLCDGVNDCAGGEDETTYCSRECTAAEYKCATVETEPTGVTVCVPLEWRCDGDAHCVDEDDEANCDAGCQPGAHKCEADGTCVAPWLRCNGRSDCADGSDERGCSCAECAGNGQVMCAGPTGQCIKRKFVCDGRADCLDESDEMNCPGSCDMESPVAKTETAKEGVPMTLITRAIVCADGRSMSERYACSGRHPECESACDVCDDELAFTCPSGDGRKCITRSMMCDGRSDCSDGADEADSLCACALDDNERLGPDAPLECVIPTIDVTANPQVRCLPAHYRCDGYADCVDESDEKDCDVCAERAGARPLLHCAAERKCIASMNVCDGVPHCRDYSDEDNCDCAVCKSHPTRNFMCPTGGRCLQYSAICSADSPFSCPTTLEDTSFCAYGWDPLQ